MKYHGIRPVSPETAASVLAEWRAFLPIMERFQRPAESGDRAFDAWFFRKRAADGVPADVVTTVGVLNRLGMEPEEIARATSLTTPRVRALLGISEGTGW